MWGRLLTCAPIGNRRKLRGLPARAQDGIPMSLSFAGAERSEVVVGRTPWPAADALVGSPGLEEADFTDEERVQGDPRRPGGLPHDCIWIPGFGKTK